MKLKIKILVTFHIIDLDSPSGSYQNVVIVNLELPEFTDVTNPQQPSLENFLSTWRANTYFNHKGIRLLYNNIKAIEITPL